MNSFLITIMCFSLVSYSVAAPFEPLMPESSPMAEFDPMPTPGGAMLYLVSAGRAPYAMKPTMLKPYSEVNVCLSKYGRVGFSIKCDVKTSSPVDFRVDGQQFRRERKMPYFLNGDKHGKIFRYKGLDDMSEVRVVCKAKGYKAVWVDLKHKC